MDVLEQSYIRFHDVNFLFDLISRLIRMITLLFRIINKINKKNNIKYKSKNNKKTCDHKITINSYNQIILDRGGPLHFEIVSFLLLSCVALGRMIRQHQLLHTYHQEYQ